MDSMQSIMVQSNFLPRRLVNGKGHRQKIVVISKTKFKIKFDVQD